MDEYFEFDGKNYIITNEIKNKEFTYYFLSNEDDMYDVMIKKSKNDDPDTIYPLDNEKEFKSAIDLLKNKMTEQFNA